MCRKMKLMIAASTLLLAYAGGATALTAITPDPVEVAPPSGAPSAEEYRRTIEAMRPPKRGRPVIAVLADNRGTEAIDFLVPYGVLRESGLADVFAVSMDPGPLKLRPALTIRSHMTAAQLDERYPDGADYVIVPAMFDHDDPEVIAWIQSQRRRGATIVAICSGGEIVSNAGLLRGRAATTHWTSVRKILDDNPDVRWVPHRRYVADRGVVSTTGVSAALPVSIALVEAIGGPEAARRVAARLGVREWGLSHDSSAYELGDYMWTALGNSAAAWNHEDLGVPVFNGVDDVALAFTADTWSRSYRSKAFTVAPAVTVRTRYGLELLVDKAPDDEDIERMLPPVPGNEPGQALERTFAQVSADYGESTARLIAIQLEHPFGAQ